jgi:hypothetical protein
VIFANQRLSLYDRALVDNKPASYFLIIIAAICFISAFGLWVYQLFIYLQTGSMPDLSVISSLSHAGYAWALFPDSWFGLWRILNFIPTSIALILAGIVLSLWAEKLSPHISI